MGCLAKGFDKIRAATTIAGGSPASRNLTRTPVQWSKEQIADQPNDPHISCRRRSHRHRSHGQPCLTCRARSWWEALMALKRVTRDHHSTHKRHRIIGDAMAVIPALSNGRYSSQIAPICRAASACVPASFCQLFSMGASRVERSRPSLARPSPASVAATSRLGACGADPHPRHGGCRHLSSGTSDINGLPRQQRCRTVGPQSDVSLSAVESLAPDGIAQATSPAVSPFSSAPPFAPLPRKPLTRQWRLCVCGQAELGSLSRPFQNWTKR